jgi:hypothetical protein|tara:strand:+ start:1312 stop:1614 length:303 start_codon:yes stop_codon:yes gene_type:complete
MADINPYENSLIDKSRNGFYYSLSDLMSLPFAIAGGFKGYEYVQQHISERYGEIIGIEEIVRSGSINAMGIVVGGIVGLGVYGMIRQVVGERVNCLKKIS